MKADFKKKPFLGLKRQEVQKTPGMNTRSVGGKRLEVKVLGI